MRRRMPRLVPLSRRTSVAKFASCRACAEQVGRCYSVYSRPTTNEPSASRRPRPVCKQFSREQTPWIGDRVLSRELRRFIHLTQPRRSSHPKSTSQSSIADSEHAGAVGEQEDDSRAPGESPTKPTKPASAAKPNLSSKMRRKGESTVKKFDPILLPPDLHNISLQADAAFFSEWVYPPAATAEETLNPERAHLSFYSKWVDPPAAAAEETHNPERAHLSFYSKWVDPPAAAAEETHNPERAGASSFSESVDPPAVAADETHNPERPRLPIFSKRVDPPAAIAEETHNPGRPRLPILSKRVDRPAVAAEETHNPERAAENHDKHHDENHDEDRDPEVDPESPTPTENQRPGLTRKQFIPKIKGYLLAFESYLASAMPNFVPIDDDRPKPTEQQGDLPSVEIMGSEPYPTDRPQSQRVERRQTNLLEHEDKNDSPEATSHPSLKELIYSFFSLYADDPKFPELGQRPRSVLDFQIQQTRFRLHLGRKELPQAEVAKIARYLFQTDDLDPGMVADLFKHMYRHQMHADIIRFALRTMEIWTAAEATSLFILHKAALPKVAMAVMFRTCVGLQQHHFARQILAEAYSDPAFAEIFGVNNSEELTELEKELFFQAQLEHSITNATDPKALSELVNGSKMSDLIRRSEETMKLVISRLIKLGDTNSAVDIVVNSVFRNPQYIFYALEIAVEEGAELSGRLDDILSSGVAQLLAAGRTFDSLRFVVDLTDRHNTMEVWSFLATGSRTAITRSEDVDHDLCTNSERLSKRLARAFLNRAIEFGDATLFLRVLQTKLPERVYIHMAPGHTAEMYELLLKRTYSSEMSVLTEQRTINMMAALLSAQSPIAARRSFQRLLSRIRRYRDVTEERKLQYVYAMLSALAKVPGLQMSARFWMVMEPIVLHGSENLRKAVTMRFRNTIGPDTALAVLHNHVDKHRATLTYDYLLLCGYLSLPKKPSRDLPEKLFSELKCTILSMLSNHSVADESEFPEVALRTTETMPAEVINARTVAVERLVNMMHEKYDLPESFFQWYLQVMMYYHQFEFVFETIMAGHEQLMKANRGERRKSKVRLNKVSQSLLEELQFKALQARQPYWALYGWGLGQFMFGRTQPEHDEKLIRLTFRLLESETKSGLEGSDFALRMECVKLMSEIRSRHIDQWIERVTNILKQGFELIRTDERESPFISPSAIMMVSEKRLTEALKTLVAAADVYCELPQFNWEQYLWRMRRVLLHRARGRHIYLIVEARYSALVRLVKNYVRLHDWWGVELELIRRGPDYYFDRHKQATRIKADDELMEAMSEIGYYTEAGVRRDIGEVFKDQEKEEQIKVEFMERLQDRDPLEWGTEHLDEASASAAGQPETRRRRREMPKRDTRVLLRLQALRRRRPPRPPYRRPLYRGNTVKSGEYYPGRGRHPATGEYVSDTDSAA
ncbi:hypothetical protein BZA70DRAFT_282186 [Myxozyma melibiosi]|uniref:Uncharacterized protein n=1 Tax=Myxozyma melibiosi TaxID=54550 RepID=A0ABR1F1V2_9ASCO